MRGLKLATVGASAVYTDAMASRSPRPGLPLPALLVDHLSSAIVRANQAESEASTGVKSSEDVAPSTDLKVNPGRMVRHAVESHRPVLLTSRGRGVAVMQSVTDYERAEEERAFMRAVVAGLADLDAGREVSFSEAKARFGLSLGRR
jgi:prevent-host-death family protein